jgi:hypothetical protein
LAFPGSAGAGSLRVDIPNWAGVNQVQVDWGSGSYTCNNTTCNIIDSGLQEDESFTVTGIPGAGYELYDWSGDHSSSLNPRTFTMNNDNENITADFRTAVILKITNPGAGSGQVDYGINGRPWTPTHLASGQVFDVSVPDGGWVYLRELAGYEDAGSVFNGYSGDGGPSGSLWFVGSIVGGENVNATFSKINYNLTTSQVGNGLITPSTTYVFDEGLWVSALPDPGWRFTKWTGPGAVNLEDPNAAGTNLINPLYADTDITATFEKNPYNLTTAQVGMGAVTPSGTYFYADGLPLTATPNAGWGFVNWTGDTANLVDPNAASTNLINPLFSDTDVTANFGQLGELAIDNGAWGGGTNNVIIQWGTNTITCGDWFCDSGFSPFLNIPEGATVTLKAVPGSMYAFTGWSGAITANTNPVTFTKGAGLETVTANFNTPVPTWMLTVDVRNGKFQNNVKIDWPNNSFTCDDFCVYNVPDGTSVTLTPVADSSAPDYWSFTNWTGMVPLPNQNDNPYVFTITGDFVAEANFTSNARKLNVQVMQGVGLNQINVDWSTGSEVCKDDCTYTILKDESVTLTALGNGSDANEWMFEKWDVGATGDTNPYNFTLSNDTTIEAHFKQGARTLTINAIGSGSGCVDASKGSSGLAGGGLVCSFPFPLGYPYSGSGGRVHF